MAKAALDVSIGMKAKKKVENSPPSTGFQDRPWYRGLDIHQVRYEDPTSREAGVQVPTDYRCYDSLARMSPALLLSLGTVFLGSRGLKNTAHSGGQWPRAALPRYWGRLRNAFPTMERGHEGGREGGGVNAVYAG